MTKINTSIVLYKNKKEHINRLVNNLLNTSIDIKINLVDNSPTDELKYLADLDPRIEYIFNNANLGYGKAHNIAIRKSIEENVPYHLVLNPDIYFEKGVLEELYEFMESNPDVGNVMPKVLYPDGEIQYLCKLLPNPMDLFGRRFLNFWPFKKLLLKRNELYELRFSNYNEIMEVPYLSGCFMFLRTSVLKRIGLFDERFFMYLEDTDLSRRIHSAAKTVFYPYVHIYHEYRKGSYKEFKLLYYHISSAIKYFNKWGWFFDEDRRNFNQRTLQSVLQRTKIKNKN